MHGQHPPSPCWHGSLCRLQASACTRDGRRLPGPPELPRRGSARPTPCRSFPPAARLPGPAFLLSCRHAPRPAASHAAPPMGEEHLPVRCAGLRPEAAQLAPRCCARWRASCSCAGVQRRLPGERRRRRRERPAASAQAQPPDRLRDRAAARGADRRRAAGHHIRCGRLLARAVFGAIVTGFLALNLLYSFWLKHVPILDVFSLASGFVLRVGAGVVLISVNDSRRGCTSA